jgi:phage protein U
MVLLAGRKDAVGMCGTQDDPILFSGTAFEEVSGEISDSSPE